MALPAGVLPIQVRVKFQPPSVEVNSPSKVSTQTIFLSVGWNSGNQMAAVFGPRSLSVLATVARPTAGLPARVSSSRMRVPAVDSAVAAAAWPSSPPDSSVRMASSVLGLGERDGRSAPG